MPTTRGFDSFFGYLAGEQDHFNQQLGGFINCKRVVDLTSDGKPAHGANGTYSGWMYNRHAVDIVKTASTPFFLNYWMQNTHAPFEVPPQYKALYKFKDERLRTFNGMISVVDEAVGNVTAALKQRGLWNNTLIVYTHDNGAPLGGGGSNFPFRGGKNSNFEGGVRVPCILGGGWAGLPSHVRNTTTDALVHVADWLPTLLSAVDGSPVAVPLVDKATPTIPYDGVNQWPALTSPNTTRFPRSDIVLDHCLANFSTAPTGCNHYGVTDQLVGAMIVRDANASTDWKLVLGPNGGEWSSQLNATSCNAFGGRACDHGCLFNLTSDPGEHLDLSQSHPEAFKAIMNKFSALSTSQYHPPSFNPPAEDAACCAAATANGNFLTPWVSSPKPPSPKPPALGPCVGGPGQEGWEVLNNTGGGGPGFTHFTAHDLGNASVEQCRRKCCESDRCVSVVLHEVRAGKFGCWLNPRDGEVKPFARPKTLLAYVKRAPSAVSSTDFTRGA